MRHEHARKIHIADQLGMDMRLTAQMLGAYRDELLKQGMTSEEVHDLVCHAAAVLFGAVWEEEDV